MKVAHPDLQPELRSLLITAAHDGGVSRRVLVKLDGGQTYVRVTVRRFGAGRTAPGLMLVLFEEQKEPASAAEGAAERERAEAAEARIPIVEKPLLGNALAERVREALGEAA